MPLLFLLAAAAPAADDVVVTAARSTEPVTVAQSGSSVTLLNSAALEQRQTRAVSDILRDVPGVAVSRVAGQTQLRLRGAEANQVLFLIDGIEVSDAYASEFDVGTLPADEGARIEVLRGQQSSLYGSDAIGGVIQYITASGRERPGISGRVEAGSFGTVNGAARVAGAAGRLDYALTGTINTTDGTPNARGGTRDLADETAAVALKANWTPSDTARVTGVLRYVNTRSQFNDTDFDPASPTFGQVVDSPGAYVKTRGLYGLLRGELDFADGRWSHALTAQFADNNRDGFNAFGPSSGNRGGRLKGSYETTLRLGEGDLRHALTLAVDAERERFRNTDPFGFAFTGTRRADNVGLVGQYRLTLGERGAVAASIRHDWNDRFADATTYRVEGSYRLATRTRLRAAAGSGIKNPTFYELYGYIDGQFIGNEDLKPEKSRGWEIGAEQNFADDQITAGATYFRSVLKNEVFTDFSTGLAVPGNRDTRSRQRGIDAYLNARLGEAWRVDLAYTWLRAREDGRREIRRPANVASAAVSWRAPENCGGLTAVVRYNGAADDDAYIDPASFAPVRVRLDDYTLVNLNGDLAIGERLSLFARVENLLGERYEDVFSFRNPRRAAYAGLKARF